MIKVLVTGSNGLLGQKIIYGYKNNPDFELIATGRGPCRMINKEGYIYEEMDISDKEAIRKIVEKHKPDSIVNTAAMTNVDACETEKEACDLLNVTSVQNLVDISEAYNIHLTHISTDFIFDGKDGPYTEEAIPKPLSYYGWSKLKSEEIVKNSKCNWAILRTVLVIGITEGMSRSNIVLWAKGALEKGQDINVVDDQFRSPTLAEDLADGCMLAVKHSASGIYNISGKDFMSVLDLVTAVAEFWNLDTSKIHKVSSTTLNQPAKRPPITGFILDKAVNDLGYKPHTFKESLAVLKTQIENYL